MSTIISLDPRVTRLGIEEESTAEPKQSLDQLQTYEVFHQVRSGAHHTHVGNLHAPTPELALILAKEQYARRGATTNLWVVNTAEVFTMRSEDSDIFDTTPDKTYRDVADYMVRSKVDAFKKAQKEEAEE